MIRNKRYAEVGIDTIQAHPKNARRGDLEAIEASIATNGFYGAVVVQDSSGRIMVGNHRWRAARARGMRTIPVIFVDCADIEAERIAVADNRVGDLGSYDQTALLEQLERIAEQEGSLAGTGYSEEDFAAIEAEMAELAGAADADEESTDDGASQDDDLDSLNVPSEPITKAGDLWLLGDHKLLCGDCFDAANRKIVFRGELADLVVTDPPYAIFGSSTGIGADIADDKMIRPFFERMFWFIAHSVREFAHIYTCCDWRTYATIWNAAKGAGLSPKNCLVWDKNSSGLGSSYANAHEFISFFARLPPPTSMKSTTRRGQRTVLAPNVARHNRVSGTEREHNAAKPVPLLEWLIGNSSDQGELVADFFIGSGSTMVAAERSKRRCYGFEIERKHCDITVARWERVTGQRARRVPAEEVAAARKSVVPEPDFAADPELAQPNEEEASPGS